MTALVGKPRGRAQKIFWPALQLYAAGQRTGRPVSYGSAAAPSS
jgi:hypothetical protein